MADRIDIYVDGSYNRTYRRVGFGYVILKNGKVFAEQSGEIKQFISSSQIGGELGAVCYALRTCALNALKEVNIYYDYIGVEKWISGEWQARKKVSQQYKTYVDFMVKKYQMTIHWHKVKAHSNDRYNDRADELAKKGAGVS